MIKIDEGYTFEFLAHFVLLLIFIVIASSLINPFLFFISPFLFILLILKTGIQIDTEQKRIRKYKSFLSYSFGKWYNLKTVKKIQLVYDSNQINKNIGYRPLYIVNKPASLKTFNLVIVTEKEKIILNKFSDRKKAYGTMKSLENIGSYELVNSHLEYLLRIQRKNRR